jgi:hypothetical protein
MKRLYFIISLLLLIGCPEYICKLLKLNDETYRS